MDRTHVGEVDFLRVFGLTTIVVIHAFGFFLSMPVSSANVRLAQELFVNLIRYGRYVFLFVTGMVLFYNYNGRKINLGRFFNRRLQNLVIPYIIWTAVYLGVDHWSHMVKWNGLHGFVILWLQNLLNGKAFYHLYYILVAIQFYLIFPWLVKIIKPRKVRLWAEIIMASGILLCAFYYYVLDMHGARVAAMFAGTHWAGIVSWFMQYKDRLIVTYLPIYLLGGLVGIHVESFRRWLSENMALVWGGMFTAVAIIVFEFFYFFLHLGQSWALTISVFKPSIYLLSMVITALFFKFSMFLQYKNGIRHLVTLLAANSLGIFLMHPAVLFIMHSYLWRYFQHLPGFLVIVLDPAAAIAVSCLISMVLGSNKYTRFIVGEAGNLRQQFPWRKVFSGKKEMGINA